MTKQTYTVSELARLIGASNQDVHNARAYRESLSVPGTKSHAVREGMKAHDITWEQVVSAKGGPAPGSVKTKKSGPVLLPVEGKTPAQDDAQPAAPAPAAPAAESAKQDEKFEAILPPAEGKTCALSLEELIAELKQRLPGAAITINL